MDQQNETNGHGHDHHKTVTIIVNTRPKEWDKKEISYREVVELAFGSYSEDENVVYTVTYTKGHEPHHEGSLVKGGSVKVKDKMIFNVSKTDKS